MAEQITCTGCGKAYRVKPELAGKKVKCKCGEVFEMPASPRAEGDEIGDLEMAAAPEPTKPAKPTKAAPPPDVQPAQSCPNCQAACEADAVLCVNCGFNLKTGTKLNTTEQTGPRLDADDLRQRDQADLQRRHLMQERIVPIALVAVGLLINVVAAQGLATQGDESATMGYVAALIGTLVEMAVGVSIMVVACFIAAKALGTSFGPLGTALLKLAGIYLFANGAINGMFLLLGFSSFWLTIGVLVLAYGGLLAWLFDLDVEEVCITVAIMIVTQWIAGLATVIVLAGVLSSLA